jgi:hypothetical protein
MASSLASPLFSAWNFIQQSTNKKESRYCATLVFHLFQTSQINLVFFFAVVADIEAYFFAVPVETVASFSVDYRICCYFDSFPFVSELPADAAFPVVFASLADVAFGSVFPVLAVSAFPADVAFDFVSAFPADVVSLVVFASLADAAFGSVFPFLVVSAFLVVFVFLVAYLYFFACYQVHYFDR